MTRRSKSTTMDRIELPGFDWRSVLRAHTRLTSDGDQRESAPGEKAVYAAPEPDGFVEELEGDLVDALAAEDGAEEPPCGRSGFIDLMKAFGDQAGAREHR